MSELDRVKEQLVYLRFWLGIMVATDCFGRLAYLYGHRRKRNTLVYGRIGAVALAAGIFLVHRQVERRIDQIGKL
jgi:hypothetical protein